MLRSRRSWRATLVTALAALMLGCAAQADPEGGSRAGGTTFPVAPDFPTHDPAHWINSPPLRMADLSGRVVLLDLWTFG